MVGNRDDYQSPFIRHLKVRLNKIYKRKKIHRKNFALSSIKRKTMSILSMVSNANMHLKVRLVNNFIKDAKTVY